MNKAEYIISCANDIISALDIKDLPERVRVGNDYFYPKVALGRARSILRADNLFNKELSNGQT